MKLIKKIKCEMQLNSSRYFDGLSLEEWHKSTCPITVDDPEERSKTCGIFGIQLDESPDIRDIPSFFLFGWSSTMGKLRTKC
jgi:hypothetical protein